MTKKHIYRLPLLIFPAFIILFIFVVYSSSKLNQSSSQTKHSPSPLSSPTIIPLQSAATTPLPTTGPPDPNQPTVIGIRPKTCCNCPRIIPSSLVGQDGWVVYQKGKDYSSFQPDYCQELACQPCPPEPEYLD